MKNTSLKERRIDIQKPSSIWVLEEGENSPPRTTEFVVGEVRFAIGPLELEAKDEQEYSDTREAGNLPC